MRTVAVDLPVPEPARVDLDSARTAVLVVDVEHEFIRSAGRRYLGERAERILAPLSRLLSRARTFGVPIIYVHSVRDPSDPEFTAFGVDLHLVRGTWGAEFCTEIAPQNGDAVVEKQCHDCFRTGELDLALERLGIAPVTHSVIVAGVALEICVSHAVFGLSVRNFRVVVPMDCSASRTEESEIVGYQRLMHRAYAHNVVLSRSDLITLSPESRLPMPSVARRPM